MGARKNNPNKFGNNPDKVTPSGSMREFAEKSGFRTKCVPSPRIFAWEIARGDTFDSFECALITYDPSVRLWAITHNAIPEVGSDRFSHPSPQAAWDWYKNLLPKQGVSDAQVSKRP
jgi:hypothetical protein